MARPFTRAPAPPVPSAWPEPQARWPRRWQAAWRDKRGPERVTRLGCALVVGGFVAMAAAPGQLWLIAVGAVVFDLGVQAALISHQSIIYSLEPAARSRLNAVFFTGLFIGTASGAWLGSLVLATWGWRGVCVLAASAGAAALAVRLWPVKTS